MGCLEPFLELAHGGAARASFGISFGACPEVRGAATPARPQATTAKLSQWGFHSCLPNENPATGAGFELPHL